MFDRKREHLMNWPDSTALLGESDAVRGFGGWLEKRRGIVSSAIVFILVIAVPESEATEKSD
jgi:hypothetical protein